MPRHADFLKVIQGVGSPLAAPSANLFGRTSPTQAEHVEAEFPTLPVVDGGSCPVGIESTILKISLASQVPHRNLEKRAEGPSPTVEIFQLEILRPGGITQEQIKKELSLKATSMGVSWVVQARQADRIESPGQIKHHYMPKKPLLLVKSEEEIATALKIISFESPSLKMPLSKGWSLGLSKEPTEAARELYSRMRELDLRPEAFGFVVGSLLWLNDPNWEAILDRLRRAASWSSI
jgi:L-threonylcarbamoyladenylate synthase